MKTKILLMIMLLIGINAKSQITWEQIFNAIAGKTESFKNVTSQVVEVNSIMKFGGITRQVVQVLLPAGTEKWYYRITVLPVSMNYSYQSNETFFYLLKNKKSMEIYSPTLYDKDNINFFIIGHSGDKSSFLSDNAFKSYYTKKNINSFIEGSTLSLDNLWIGIENPNKVHGLKVIVEVVAWGYFN